MSNHLTNLVIAAKDQATAVIDSINAKLRVLTGKPHVITVGAKVNASAITQINAQLASIKPPTVTIPVKASVVGGAKSAVAGIKSAAASIAAAATPMNQAVELGQKAAQVVGEFADNTIGDFTRLGAAVEKFATTTGSTFEDASKFIAVAEDMGLPIDMLQTKIARMDRAAQKTPEVFGQIGASIVRSADGTLDSVATFQSVISALAAVPDAGKRAAVGTKLFEDEWVSLGRLIAESGTELNNRLANVDPSQVFDKIRADKAMEAGRAFTDLGNVVQGVLLDIGEELAPAVADVAVEIGDVAKASAPMAKAFAEATANMIESLGPLIDSTVLYLNLLSQAGQADIAPGVDLSIFEATFGGGLGVFVTALKKANDAFGDAPKLAAGIDLVAKSTGRARDAANSYDAMLRDIQNNTDFSKNAADWNTVFRAIGQGSATAAETTSAIDRLAFALNIEPKDVLKLANDRMTAYAKSAEEAAKNTADLADQMTNAEASLIGFASVFSRMERSEDALKRAFDLGDAPIKTLEQVTSIHDAMRDLDDFLRKPAEEIAKINDEIADLQTKRVRVDGKKAAQDVADINDQIQDLVKQRAKYEKQLKVPNIFDANDVRSGEFLDKVRSMREPIHQAIMDAFAGGGGGQAGAQAARATANQYVNELYKMLGGKIKKGDIEALLSLSDLDVTLKVALDEESMAAAKGELDILTGFNGKSPYTAAIELALAAGTLSPTAAQFIIQQKLKELHIPVPIELAPANSVDTARAKREAQRFMDQNKTIAGSVLIPTAAAIPGEDALAPARKAAEEWFASKGAVPIRTIAADPTEDPSLNLQPAVDAAQVWMDGQDVGIRTIAKDPTEDPRLNIQPAVDAAQVWLNGQYVELPVRVAFVPPSGQGGGGSLPPLKGPRRLDAGGTAGGFGGIAGERGPEILNERYLTSGPTYVPPGTRVTSRVRTERILRTRGTRGLRRYDSGGTVQGGPVTVNINAGVIGNRFDVMRAVRRANIDKIRLLGTRGA